MYKSSHACSSKTLALFQTDTKSQRCNDCMHNGLNVGSLANKNESGYTSDELVPFTSC